jgi:DNA-binding response OmpR family regulator
MVVLDRNLNGESSLPLARYLAERGIAIIYVSGCQPSAQCETETDGDHIYLQKPVSPRALVAAVSAASRRKRTVSDQALPPNASRE